MRRTSLWVALSMIGAGSALLLYFAWQYVGTNLLAHHRQREHIAGLVDRWESGGATGEQVAVADAESQTPPRGRANALLRVPRFGSTYVMPVLEGTTDQVLAEGVGHVESSAGAGQVGNYALAAHRVTHGEPFAQLPELRPGDTVEVETRTMVYTYVLDTDPNDLVVPYTADWVLADAPVNPSDGPGPELAESDRLITLTTCSELFHTDDRLVAFGHLQDARAK